MAPLAKFLKGMNAYIIIMVPRIVQVFVTKNAKTLNETKSS